MSRGRFPSDDRWNDQRRKVKPHVRIHHSIQNHPKTVRVYANNDLLATWLRVMLLASERGAAHTDDTIHITRFDLLRLAGTREGDETRTEERRARNARRTLERLCGHAGWTFQGPRGDEPGTIHIPNFAKKQGIATRETRSSEAYSAELRGPPLSPSPLPGSDTTYRGETPPGLDPKKILWDSAVAVFREANIPEKEARSFIGKQVQNYGKPEVLSAIGRMVADPPADPKGFLVGCLKSNTGRRGKPDELPGSRRKPPGYIPGYQPIGGGS